MQPGPYGEPSRTLWSSDRLVLLIVFLIFVFVVLAVLEAAEPGAVLPAMGSVFCVAFLVILVALLSFVRAYRQRTALSPPPPVQQPMAPAGGAAPVSLNCPNCGAPPTSVDRFGVATCTHCGARFLVR